MKPNIIQELEKIIGQKLHAVPNEVYDPLTTVMVQKGSFYAEGERVLGLNLAGMVKDIRKTGATEKILKPHFKDIQALNMSDNSLSFWESMPKNIQYLSFENAKDCKRLQLPNDMPNLKRLNVSGCELWDFGLKGSFPTLRLVEGQRLVDIMFFDGTFPVLEKVDFSEASFLKVNFKGTFPLLSHLFLQKNKELKEVRNLSFLSTLKTVNISNTSIKDLSPLLGIMKAGVQVSMELGEYSAWDGIRVAGCHLPSPLIDEFENGPEAIIRYLEQIAQQHGTESINEVKVIIVGEGKTGKTTLLNKLLDERFDPNKTETDETHGINIESGLSFCKNEDGEEIKINIWDFGGQELQYMTHQFFLTPDAYYVLMMDGRTEAPNLPYWLKIISLLAKRPEDKSRKIPLLMVVNKKPDSTGKAEIRDIFKHYEENFETELPLVADLAKNKGHFFHVRNKMQEDIANMPMEYPAQWPVIREALTKETKPYISWDRFATICSENGVEDGLDQEQLSRALHRIGSILHFQEDSGLYHHIFLKPKWVVDGIYTFIKNETELKKRHGHFTENQFKKILAKKDYSTGDAKLILQLMTQNKFDICYQAPNKQYIIVQYLADKEPENAWYPQRVDGTKSASLQFRYQYTDIMPHGLVSRLVVRLHDSLEKNEKGGQIVWKTGGVFSIKHNKQECRVKIEEDDAKSSGLKQIKIEVLGQEQARKHALSTVRNEIEELHKKWFRAIKYAEIVPCCCVKCEISPNPDSYELHNLLEIIENWDRKNGEPKKQCKSTQMVSIPLLLNGVYYEDEVSDFGHFERFHTWAVESSQKEPQKHKTVPCTCSECSQSVDPIYYKYSELIKRKEKGKKTVECNRSYEDVNVLQLIDSIRIRESNDSLITKTLFRMESKLDQFREDNNLNFKKLDEKLQVACQSVLEEIESTQEEQLLHRSEQVVFLEKLTEFANENMKKEDVLEWQNQPIKHKLKITLPMLLLKYEAEMDISKFKIKSWKDIKTWFVNQ